MYWLAQLCLISGFFIVFDSETPRFAKPGLDI